MPVPTSPPPTPVIATAPTERALLPDVLRGAALWGILCVNMQDFAGYSEWQQTGIDRAAQVVIDLFINGKAVSVFALLFGAGAYTLLTRGGAGLLLRRLVTLLGLGLAHYILVWHGDIIANYAVLALALLPLAAVRWRLLAWLGSMLCLGWLGFTGLQAAVEYSGIYMRGNEPELPATYLTLVWQRLQEALPNLLGVVVFDGAWLLGLFCLGGALYRSGVLYRPAEHTATLRRLLWLGLLGLPLSILLAWCNTQSSYFAALLGLMARFGGGVCLGLVYLGALGLLVVAGRTGPLRHLAASGRLSMTNYFAQSIAMTWLCYPYGGGLYGHLGAAGALLIALIFGAAQVALSGLYLRYFERGPAEWLVRRLVYGR